MKNLKLTLASSLVCFLILALLFVGSLWSKSRSTTFEMTSHVICATGGTSQSPNYVTKVSAGGQGSPIGFQSSTNFKGFGGWVYTAVPPFICGDANGDGEVNLADAVYIVNYLFIGGPPPDPLEAGDANDDGEVDLADAVYIINYLFIGGPRPCGGKGTISLGRELQLYKGKTPAQVGFSSPIISRDGIFNVPVIGNFDADLAGVQLEIKYDPEEIVLLEPDLTPRTEGLTIYSSSNGSRNLQVALPPRLERDGCQDTQKIDLLRSLQVGIVDLSGEHYISAGTGALVNLRVKGSDLSTLEITKAILVDRDAQKITVSIVSKMKESEEDFMAGKSAVPQEFSLSQNYPNPFNPETEIKYALPQDCDVTLIIYNILGEKTKVLINEYQTAGFKTVYWNGKDEKGKGVASGTYFYRIKAGDFSQSRKMVLVK